MSRYLHKSLGRWLAATCVALIVAAVAPTIAARAWTEADFEHRPLYAYPLPSGHDDVIGDLLTYRIRKGDTLLDVGRWYGLSATEISDANGHIDWWLPPVGKEIVLPTERILPEGPRVGVVLNIPEMRLYYFYPSSPEPRKRKGKLTKVAFAPARVVYTFPVGLGRFDWKTPIGDFKVRGKTKDPTWVVPDDIYKEHLERDGEAEHMIPGGDPDNPLGLFRIELTLPEYAIHGTNIPWGVGMEVSHGCVRLYPEDIKSLFYKVKVGTPGRFVYQPIKFGWRGPNLYVEVHDDLYGRFPGLWNHALHEVKRLGLTNQVDFDKLQTAVEAKNGVPTYIGTGPEIGGGTSTGSSGMSETAVAATDPRIRPIPR